MTGLLTRATLALYLLPLLPIMAQGPLAPPGPPAPSMRTLLQIEPRTPIESLPFTITAPGSYFLTSVLNGGGTSNGILIESDDVSLDLNGFSLVGCTTGIQLGPNVGGSARGISIFNGNIKGCLNSGIDLGNASKCQLQGVNVCNNGANGANIGEASRVTDCTASGNGADGIITGNASSISHCIVQSNVANGIVINSQSTATWNTCDANGTAPAHANIHVAGNGNRIEENHCNRGLGFGIIARGQRNLIIKNSACDNAITGYNIVPGNDYGQILSSPGAGFVNSNPWANFSCTTPSPGFCLSNADCDHLDTDCTDGVCSQSSCQTVPKPDGIACPSGTCVNGACVPAATCNDSILNGNETDVDCGGPNCQPCNVGQMCFAGSDCNSGSCQNGFCQLICPAGQTMCGGQCINTTSDPIHCGACGNRCPDARPNQTVTCQGGNCVSRCNPGFSDCDGSPINGCETDIRTSNSNCSACGSICPAGSVCVSGACLAP